MSETLMTGLSVRPRTTTTSWRHLIPHRRRLPFQERRFREPDRRKFSGHLGENQMTVDAETARPTSAG